MNIDIDEILPKVKPPKDNTAEKAYGKILKIYRFSVNKCKYKCVYCKKKLKFCFFYPYILMSQIRKEVLRSIYE